MVPSIKALVAAYPQVNRLLIEKAAAGGPIAEQLKRDMAKAELRAIAITEINPKLHGSKTDRVVACLPQLEAGLVHLLDGASWIDEFVGEHGTFPNGQHDDRVDALSQALIYYNGSDTRARFRALARAGS
jgi:predicted phage terminase large subunit-like protein